METYYGKKGYDLLVNTSPYHDLVSFSAYKDIKKGKEIPIGIYSLDTLSSLVDDVKEKIKV